MKQEIIQSAGNALTEAVKQVPQQDALRALKVVGTVGAGLGLGYLIFRTIVKI